LGWVQTCKSFTRIWTQSKNLGRSGKLDTRFTQSFFLPWGQTTRPFKKERAEELLTILFDKILHNGYFGKLPFGSKGKFAKMTNTTLPLVVLTWLRQLEEYF
jgi:hypothetical protein